MLFLFLSHELFMKTYDTLQNITNVGMPQIVYLPFT